MAGRGARGSVRTYHHGTSGCRRPVLANAPVTNRLRAVPASVPVQAGLCHLAHPVPCGTHVEAGTTHTHAYRVSPNSARAMGGSAMEPPGGPPRSRITSGASRPGRPRRLLRLLARGHVPEHDMVVRVGDAGMGVVVVRLHPDARLVVGNL